MTLKLPLTPILNAGPQTAPPPWCQSTRPSPQHISYRAAWHTAATTRGLDLDPQAATVAVTLPFHNGRTEGVNTKTKMIKRQMYGRAGSTLLRHQILLS